MSDFEFISKACEYALMHNLEFDDALEILSTEETEVAETKIALAVHPFS